MSYAIEGWVRDLGQAARSLARAPGFVGVTVITLALAIGANATIFSVVDAVLLQPLPFSDADRLVVVGGTAPGTDLPEDLGVPDELYVEYAAVVPSLEDLALYNTGSSTTRPVACSPTLMTSMWRRPGSESRGKSYRNRP